MGWKDQLQIASFRDVPFFINSSSMNFGRRVISHEFPFGDKPFTEDLGKKSRTFNLDGFLIGENYFAERDKLIAVCEEVGPGVLVHPYFGRMQVNCLSLSVHEAIDEGRIANLSFQFIESSEALVAVVDADKIKKVSDSSASMRKSSLDNFKEIYAVVDTVKSGIQKAKEAVKQSLDNLNKAQKLCADIAQTGNDLSQLIKESSNALDKIILFPDKVCTLFEDAYKTLSLSIDKLRSKNDQKSILTLASLAVDLRRINAWLDLSKNKINQVQILNSSSKEARLERKNKDIIELTANAVALSYLVDCAAKSTFSNSDELGQIRNTILSHADEILENSLVSDDMFNTIQNMKSCLCESMASVENKLPLISIYTIHKNTNILSFLYEQFGNIDKEDDLLIRNKIQDPFDIKAGSIFKVAI